MGRSVTHISTHTLRLFEYQQKMRLLCPSSFFPCLCALYMLRKGTQVSQAEKKAATSAPKTHRSRATTTRPAANCPKERELAAALTRTPPAAKIKLTAVHMV